MIPLNSVIALASRRNLCFETEKLGLISIVIYVKSRCQAFFGL